MRGCDRRGPVCQSLASRGHGTAAGFGGGPPCQVSALTGGTRVARACQRDRRGDCTLKPVAHNAWRFSNGVSRFTDLVMMPVGYFQGRLRASLYGILLHTLPDLVTPLKGRSLSPRSCPAMRSAPSERFGY